jgi:hypothetical protein
MGTKRCEDKVMVNILELREALIHLFQNEFQNCDVQNAPTQLEKLQLTDDNFDQLEYIEYVEVQMALEGDYVNISLLPLVIHEMKDQLCSSKSKHPTTPTGFIRQNAGRFS